MIHFDNELFPLEEYLGAAYHSLRWLIERIVNDNSEFDLSSFVRIVVARSIPTSFSVQPTLIRFLPPPLESVTLESPPPPLGGLFFGQNLASENRLN